MKLDGNHIIELRMTSIHDLDILVHWDTQPHIQASIPYVEWNWKEELTLSPKWREQLIAELDGTPIGFVQIIDPAQEETHYWGDIRDNLRAIDIWIGEPSALNKGYGTVMMNIALARCFSDKSVQAVVIDPMASNRAALRFYERIGFTFVEERTFEGIDCHVYKIDRKSWPHQ